MRWRLLAHWGELLLHRARPDKLVNLLADVDRVMKGEVVYRRDERPTSAVD